MADFLQYWRPDTWSQNEDQVGKPMFHTASDQYRRRGVKEGDRIFVATVLDGEFFLVGRLWVQCLVSQAEAESIFLRRVWTADLHAIGDERRTALIALRLLTASELDDVAFVDADGRTTPILRDGAGRVDAKCLQTMRTPSPLTAGLFERRCQTP